MDGITWIKAAGVAALSFTLFACGGGSSDPNDSTSPNDSDLSLEEWLLFTAPDDRYYVGDQPAPDLNHAYASTGIHPFALPSFDPNDDNNSCKVFIFSSEGAYIDMESDKIYFPEGGRLSGGFFTTGGHNEDGIERDLVDNNYNRLEYVNSVELITPPRLGVGDLIVSGETSFGFVDKVSNIVATYPCSEHKDIWSQQLN